MRCVPVALVLSWGLCASEIWAQGLVNLSARGTTSAGGELLTAGFVVAGNSSKRVLVRAAGPALGRLGVTGVLTAVRLELFRGATSLAVNSAWDGGADALLVVQAGRTAGAFEFPAGSRDAAILALLAPGSYTAQVAPGAGASNAGVALVEVYDVEPESAARLVNLSARALAGEGPETFIAGFVVGGQNRNRVLVRGVGPALAGFGVTGALANPRLEVFRESSGVAYNDDWGATSNAPMLAEVSRRAGAFALATAAGDAALILPAANGAYTAHVTSASGGTGVALIEVYDTAGNAGLPSARSLDLVGFARVAGHGLATVSGGGTPTGDYNPVTRTGNFWRIDDATVAALGASFATQLQAALSGDQPLVVELNTLLDVSRAGRPNNGAMAIAHPDLFAAGRTTGTIGTLAIGSNKTIYSAYGNGGFRRGSLTISGKSNIILRNLKFRELWEWDDATSGAYDRNGWDYITVSSSYGGASVTARAHHLWIDHCDFEKAYDGLFDFVHGADLITVSWCKLGGTVSGETARWVERQMEYLEANRARFPYYNSLRAGATAAELLRREVFQKKANLVGNSTDADTIAHDLGYLNVTFHHNWYVSVDQRMPRMRLGNAHVFNLLVDSSAGRDVSGLSQAGVAATSNAAVLVENSRFIESRTPITTGAGSEPDGRIAVIGSVNYDSANRVDKGFDPARLTPWGSFRWNPPASATGLADWPGATPAVMPAGYAPAGATYSSYLDAADALEAGLATLGVVVPADAGEAEQLRRILQSTTVAR